MKRRLLSTMLCALALLLLMGAGVEPSSSEAQLIEKNSFVRKEAVFEKNIIPGIQLGMKEKEQEIVSQEESVLVIEELHSTEKTEEIVEDEEMIVVEVPAVDAGFLIDGKPAPEATGRTMVNGVTYVAIAPTVLEFAPDAQVSWDSGSRTVTVRTADLHMTATVGQLYVQANGRYLYAQDGVQMHGDRVMVPLRILTKVFKANLSWDSGAAMVRVQRGSGVLVSGDQYYNQDDLFWLSRVIYAESGNQSLKGQMAVGNVVMNRVHSPMFPNSVHEIIAQRNQFTTYRGGKLANRTPNESSVIAAKLVLDGGVVAESEGALYFDSLVKSWAARSRTYVCTIGGHKFYR